MVANRLAWLLLLGLLLALPMAGMAQDFTGLNRSGTGSGGTGTGDGYSTGGTGTGGDPVTWDGPRYRAYSPEMHLVFERMLDYYRKYLEAFSYSEAEVRARRNYERYRDEYHMLRARGGLLYPHQSPAIRDCLRAYNEYQKAFSGSVQEKMSKLRYDEILKDVEALGLLPEYSVPVGEAYDKYFEHYRKYQEAFSGSVEEAYHKKAMELYKRQTDRSWGWGRRMTGGLSEAEREYLYWKREQQRAMYGSAAEAIARLRAEAYLRELEYYRGGTGNGNIGTGNSGFGSGNTGSTWEGSSGTSGGSWESGTGTGNGTNRRSTGTGSGNDFGRPRGSGTGSGTGTGTGTGSGY